MVSLLAGAFLLLQIYEHDFCEKIWMKILAPSISHAPRVFQGFLLMNNPYIPTLFKPPPSNMGIWKKQHTSFKNHLVMKRCHVYYYNQYNQYISLLYNHLVPLLPPSPSPLSHSKKTAKHLESNSERSSSEKSRQSLCASRVGSGLRQGTNTSVWLDG